MFKILQIYCQNVAHIDKNTYFCLQFVNKDLIFNMATTEKIDQLDKKILNILSKNARIPFKDVAAECGVSRAAIHQRVQHLIEANVIMGSGFDVNPKSLGIQHLYLCGYNVGAWFYVQGCGRLSPAYP